MRSGIRDLLLFLGNVSALVLLSGCASTGGASGDFPPFEVRVEVEEDAFEVPAYKVTNNGSGMFWAMGSTQLVRVGDRLFASAFEHVEGCAPLNNARWALYERHSDSWHLCQRDGKDRTREPSPLAVSHDGRLLMSVNPTLALNVDRSKVSLPPSIFNSLTSPVRTVATDFSLPAFFRLSRARFGKRRSASPPRALALEGAS